MSSVEKLKESITGLTIIVPTAESLQVIPDNELAAFRETALEFIQRCDLPVATADDFARAGEMVSACEAVATVLSERFEKPVSEANKAHKALTGTRKELLGPFEEVAAAMRRRRAEWRATEDARIARERVEAERKAREEAERAAAAARAEVARAAAEAKRVADEVRAAAEAAAAKAKADAEAATAIEDPDEAMAALAAAEEEAEREVREAKEKADRLADAARAAEDEAARAASAPVVVERVAVVEQPKEQGVTWVDNWTAEYDPAEAVKALVAAGRVEFLLVNDKAVQAAARSQKGLASIPGVMVVNKKTERRSQR